MQNHFYGVIIGTEILNARRQDKHFSFLQKALAKYGHELFASFILKDDKELITQTYKMIAQDKKSVMFSFGGIGSTPDDLTREIASQVFRNAPLELHEKFREDIYNRFGKEGSKHRINMAMLPPDVELLKNPVNNMSGFALDKRFFFTPGFPSMAHPMVEAVLEKYFSHKTIKYRKTLYAYTSENQLIDIMKQLPSSIELSSLPVFHQGTPHVELSLAGLNSSEMEHFFQLFIDELNNKKIDFKILPE